MKVRVPIYFNDFKCIASECEDTCCAGWGIVIDDETHDYYENVEGEFGEILRSKIVKDDDGDNVFLLNNGNCSFLNKDKMCDIYINLGEEHLCHTCKQFPRYTEEFLDLREIGISLSCPEAARIILRKPENNTFQLSEEEICEDNREENDFNEGENYFDEGIDEEVLSDFLGCRDVVFNIMEHADLDLGTKAALTLKFVKEVQNKIDLGNMDEIEDVIEEYKEEKFLNKLIKDLDNYKRKESAKYTNLYEYFNVYKSIKHINSNDPLGLDNGLKYLEGREEFYVEKHREFNEYYKENLYKFKNILVYFIFRYFMKAIFDYDMSAKIKLAIISTLMIKELSVIRFIDKGEFTEEDMVEVSRIYSKDIEHSDENIEDLQEIFETKDIFEVDEIITILMNDF
ncbi:flagellin lysine-N-methylase [Clostridium sp. LIBA-8841]|uniref:flagellin lysine-N-methylase n=1 Tax=Clostridium sp. LIBA-8841 TaxID=2987530 RepID=UPI002AC52EEE|nr:flagellin lysine-N-methylase [Clostridium sp. LIBA-8841]MDZ5253812.1 flagellin lysine-N-methylase [Clostridium sp. LIBA-8841]